VLDGRAVLQMERAELDVHDRDLRLGLRTDDVPCERQRVQGGVAPHEADENPLDARPQTEPADDLHVEPGRVEPGAGHDDQMGDLVLDFGEAGSVEGCGGKLDRVLLEKTHADTGIRKPPDLIEAALVEGIALVTRAKVGIAVFYLRLLNQPAKHAPLAIACKA
jgi:hypothetical protein